MNRKQRRQAVKETKKMQGSMNKEDEETMKQAVSFSHGLFQLVQSSGLMNTNPDTVMQQMATMMCAICVNSGITEEHFIEGMRQTFKMVLAQEKPAQEEKSVIIKPS